MLTFAACSSLWQHVEIHWQGSAVLNPPPPPAAVDPSARLLVKVFTAADPRKRGVELELEIGDEETVGQLKDRICKIEGTPAEVQRFKSNRGKFLEDDKATLESCGIAHGMTLFVVLQPPVTPESLLSPRDSREPPLSPHCISARLLATLPRLLCVHRLFHIAPPSFARVTACCVTRHPKP